MMDTLAGAALAASASPALSIVIKATLLFGLGLAGAAAASGARASIRHLVLAATFVAAVVLPVAAATVPPLAIPVATVPARTLPETNPTPTSASRPIPFAAAVDRETNAVINGGTMVGAVWALGVVLFLLPLAGVGWHVRRLRRTAIPWTEAADRARTLARERGLSHTIDVLWHEETQSPLTFGWRRPAIVLPADARSWDVRDIERALVHELEHVSRGDWATLVFARAVCAVYWFHPFAWIAWRRLGLEAERACDDAVVVTHESAAYATQLVSLAERLAAANTAPVLGMAKRSDLATRVTAVLDAGQRRGRAGLRISALIAVSASMLVLVVAPTRAVATGATVTVGDVDAEGQRGPGRRQHALDRELFEAAESGDIEGVREMLAAGANVNAVLDGDGSPLIAASRRGRIDIVRFLIELGADSNLGVEGDGSPLIAAAAEGHMEIVALLLDRGAHVDNIVAGDETALIQASGEGHLPVVRLLVERGANVDFGVMVTNWHGEQEWRSPLTVARRAGHADVVAYLLSAGARQ